MLCKDSWINISWDGNLARTNKENLKVTFNQRAKTLINFDQICDQTAKEIYASHKNLYLALSGGSDSEHIATCLHRNHIPFTPLVLNYSNLKTMDQKYEQWYALRWCKQNQIQPMIIELDEYKISSREKELYSIVKPRIYLGSITIGYLYDIVSNLGGQLITGSQLEYFPDHEQMNYLNSSLGDYNGFVMQESDFYLETIKQNQHPWAFYYWSAEMMASFVYAWNPNITMQENKSKIYKTTPRPKFAYPYDFITPLRYQSRKALADSKWGTRDCALLGNKDYLLSQLLE